MCLDDIPSQLLKEISSDSDQKREEITMKRRLSSGSDSSEAEQTIMILSESEADVEVEQVN